MNDLLKEKNLISAEKTCKNAGIVSFSFNISRSTIIL